MAGFRIRGLRHFCLCHRIGGCCVNQTAHAGFVLGAMEPAVHQQQLGSGLTSHSDRGLQYLFIRDTKRLAEAVVEPPVGSIADSYKNALAEIIICLFKAESV